MLTKRIIPCLDVDDGRVVKGVGFLNLRDAGDPAEMASFYDNEGADELVFLDITASSDSREIMQDVVQKVSERVFIPLTVGGGLRHLKDMRGMLKAGADKVSINTAAVTNDTIISEASTFFGSQCIVVAIDVKSVAENVNCHVKSSDSEHVGSMARLDQDSRWQVYINGGQRPTGLDAVKWAIRASDLGAGELLITSMDMDGHLGGYDLELIRTISESVSIPVIASGGAGNLGHLYDALEVGKADAVLAASIFHFGTYSIREVKEHLLSRGVPVRPNNEMEPIK